MSWSNTPHSLGSPSTLTTHSPHTTLTPHPLITHHSHLTHHTLDTLTSYHTHTTPTHHTPQSPHSPHTPQSPHSPHTPHSPHRPLYFTRSSCCSLQAAVCSWHCPSYSWPSEVHIRVEPVPFPGSVCTRDTSLEQNSGHRHSGWLSNPTGTQIAPCIQGWMEQGSRATVRTEASSQDIGYSLQCSQLIFYIWKFINELKIYLLYRWFRKIYIRNNYARVYFSSIRIIFKRKFRIINVF